MSPCWASLHAPEVPRQVPPLQAHMEMMNVLGTRLDERGRRPWEGTSRTDIRSVRNQFR